LPHQASGAQGVVPKEGPSPSKRPFIPKEAASSKSDKRHGLDKNLKQLFGARMTSKGTNIFGKLNLHILAECSATLRVFMENLKKKLN
jgi:hypothetical protein